MPIDPKQVKWDEGGIDPKAITWDEPEPTEVKTTERIIEPPGQEEESGILDELKSRGMLDRFLIGALLYPMISKITSETGAMMATGTAAEPISGLAGLAGAMIPGETDQSERWRAKTAEALTYEPKEPATLKTLGTAVEVGKKAAQLPGVKQVIEAPRKITESIVEEIPPEYATLRGITGMIGESAVPAILELLPLKGTRAAKKEVLRKSINKENISHFYDDAGNIRPDVRDKIKQSGLTMDEVESILPENITTQQAAIPLAEQIKTATGWTLTDRAKMQIAKQYQPNLERIQAFDELDIDFLGSYVADNPTAAAIEQNLKLIGGSLIDKKERGILNQVADKLDGWIERAGSSRDKARVSMEFRDEGSRYIQGMLDYADGMYKEVAKRIPKTTDVTTSNILGTIERHIENAGGIEYLSARERRLYKAMQPDSNPTYGRMDMFRRDIGRAIGAVKGKASNFDKSDPDFLKQLYGAMTKDQELSILRRGDQELLATYMTGRELFSRAKGAEKQLIELIGKDFQGDVLRKVSPTVLDLQKGYTDRFRRTMQQFPEDLGPEAKKKVVVASMNDAFIQRSGKEKSLNIAGFDDYWRGLKRHKEAYNELEKVLGWREMKRLNTFHMVVEGIRKAQEHAKATGRQLSTPGLFDEVNGIAARLYGAAKKTPGRLPVIGRYFGDMLESPKNARQMAADELLSKPMFRRMLRDYAEGKLDDPATLQRAENLLGKFKEYKNWEKNLPPADQSDLAALGIMGYMVGETTRPEEEPTR